MVADEAERARGAIRAAGAVLWRPGTEGPQVALVHRRRYDDWSLPKGKSLPGEHVLLTAVREVAEETGVRVVLGRRLPSTHYARDGRPKVVDYWAARAADVPQPRFQPNDEVDRLDWLELPAARDRLSYPHDAAVLDSFAAGPPDTIPFILVRHASAGSKTAWRAAGHEDDLIRPLDEAGHAAGRRAGTAAGLLRPGPGAQLGGRTLHSHRPALRGAGRPGGPGGPGVHRGHGVRRGEPPPRR